MTKNVKFSLSRAHKIAERITREIMTLNTSIQSLLQPVTINIPEEAQQIDLAVAKVEKLLTLRESLYGVQENLKAKIAEKNSTAGIPVLLNRRSVIQKRKEHINDIISSLAQQDLYSRAAGKTSVLKDRSLVEGYFARSEKANVLNSVKVNVVSEELSERFQKELNQTQSQLDALSDEINTKNAKYSISLDIPEDIAETIGL